MAFSVLRHEEGVRLDPTCLVELHARLGEDRAEHVLGAALEELSARMSDVGRLARSGDETRLIRCAERLAMIARDVGMTTLARVAADVAGATLVGDRIARDAIIARLDRIADRSFAAIWDLRDVSL